MNIQSNGANLYLTTTSSSTNIYIHKWGGSDATTWPGYQIVASSVKFDNGSGGFYSHSLTSTNYLLHNNAGAQTGNFTITEDTWGQYNGTNTFTELMKTSTMSNSGIVQFASGGYSGGWSTKVNTSYTSGSFSLIAPYTSGNGFDIYINGTKFLYVATSSISGYSSGYSSTYVKVTFNPTTGALSMAEVPTITSFAVSSPGSGTSGYVGNTITITGTKLTGITSVKVGGSGGSAVSTYTIVNSTTITFPAITASGTLYVSDGTDNATSTSSYTNLGYITKAAANWNATSTWLGDGIPSSGSKVTIDHNVTLDLDANVSSLTVNSGKTFTASDATPRTLTIAAGGTLTNNGTFAPGTGTVAFAGAGTISGSSPVSLYNMSFASGSTINVANSVSSSQLFNMASGSAYTFNFTNNATFTTAGISSTGTNTLNLLNGGSSGSSKFITSSDLTISDGTSLSLGTSALPLQVNGNVALSGTGSLTLGSNVGGDILLTGNWSRNSGTFTPRGRAVTFNGTGTQTMTNTNSGALTFDYLAINKSGGSVQLGSDVSVSNNLQLFTGTLDLNQKNITLNSNLEIGIGTSATTESIISSGGAGTVIIPTTKTATVTQNGSGTPSFSFGSNVTLSVTGTFNPGSGLTTFASGSTLQLNSGDKVTNNSPVYSAGSALVYNLNNGSGSKINQGLEWPATSGANVTLSNNSWVQLTGNHSLTGNLTVTKGALQASGAQKLTMSGSSQTITVSDAVTTTTDGAIYGTDNGSGNDLTLEIAEGSITTFTGDASPDNDNKKKFFNITVNSGGTLALSRGILCKYGTFAVNGTLQINADGYVQATNGQAAKYDATSSNLVYNTGGSYSTTNYEWPATYSPVNVTVQNTGTAVLLTGNRTISGNLTISAGSFTIGSTQSLTVTGTLTNSAGNPGLVIKSDNTGTGSLKHNTDNVPATIERYVTGSSDPTAGKYHFVSVPVTANSDPTSNIFLGSYLFDFTESSNTWLGLGPATGTGLTVTRGYMTYSRVANETYLFKGKLNNGSFTATTSYSGSGKGWNLVPNPYPSAIDWNAASGWTKTAINGSIYFWPAGKALDKSNYAIWNGSYGTNNGTQYIPVGQSFFVEASAASPELSMNNSVRVHNSQAFWKSTKQLPALLRIKAQAAGSFDEIIVHFSESASAGFDSDFDAHKLLGGENAPQLSTVIDGGSELSINSLPFANGDQVVPIHFTLNRAEDVTFTASGLESFDALTPVMLEDKTEGKIIDLRQQPEYTFSYDPSNPAGRFQLRFANITGISPGEKLQGTVFLSGGKLNVNVPAINGSEAAVDIFSVSGQLLSSRRMVLNGTVQLSAPAAPGMYLVKITSGNKVYVEKFIISRNN